jgi:rRNA maturation RNase YbeY
MINIDNKQTTPIDLVQLKHDAKVVLKTLGYANFDLGILIANLKDMHEYNLSYREQDKPTDILSFPYHPHLKAGERIVTEINDDKDLGDIVLCPQYILDDLARWEVSYERRLQILLVHGICHLLGYDHIEDEDYEIMKQQEELLLAALDQANQKACSIRDHI